MAILHSVKVKLFLKFYNYDKERFQKKEKIS